MGFVSPQVGFMFFDVCLFVLTMFKFRVHDARASPSQGFEMPGVRQHCPTLCFGWVSFALIGFVPCAKRSTIFFTRTR